MRDRTVISAVWSRGVSGCGRLVSDRGRLAGVELAWANGSQQVTQLGPIMFGIAARRPFSRSVQKFSIGVSVALTSSG